MKLVVDANALFVAIIAKGKELQSKTLDIFFSDKAELFAPFRLLAELEKNREEIKAKSGFSESEFDAFVGVLKLRIRFLPLEEFLDSLDEAKTICPHLKDLEYFALALKLNCAIWSNEKRLKEHQKRIKVYNTAELLSQLTRKNSAT